MQGGIDLIQRQYDNALAKQKKSVGIDPNYYGGHHMLAQVMFYLGRFEESLEQEKKAIRLSPHYPALFLVSLARNYFHLGRYEEAIATLKQLEDRAKKGEYPTWWAPSYFAMVCAESDRENDARTYMAKALRLNPNLSLEFWKSYSRFFKNPAHLHRELDALRKAGMPEKLRGATP
jgi:tetratricopeptide (TPR) repeat protein